MSQTPEVLDEHNEWFCSECKKHVRATKTYQLYKTPDYMIIHLKRFKQRGYWNDKLTTMVEFPVEGLDMTPYVINQTGCYSMMYDLYAISNHYGGLGGGHYTAFAKNGEDWHEFDDTHVKKV
jgi:ubiquitin carboxyl-terminal hydrolase 4/11/15